MGNKIAYGQSIYSKNINSTHVILSRLRSFIMITTFYVVPPSFTISFVVIRNWGPLLSSLVILSFSFKIVTILFNCKVVFYSNIVCIKKLKGLVNGANNLTRWWVTHTSLDLHMQLFWLLAFTYIYPICSHLFIY